MTTSRLRHVGAAAAVSLVASSGVALVTAVGPAAAVTPHHRPTPIPSDDYSLSIAVASSSIQRGQTDTVSGVLSKLGVPQSGDTVILRARPDHGRWFGHRVASAVTGIDGSVHFTVHPDRTTHYRLVFRATASTSTPSPVPTPTPTPTSTPMRGSRVVAQSRDAVVHVVRPASLSIREKQRGVTGREVIEGQLRGGGRPLPGRLVMLQEQAPGGTAWTTIATHRTHRDGVVKFLAPRSTTAEQFQLGYAGDTHYSGCQSGVVTVNAS